MRTTADGFACVRPARSSELSGQGLPKRRLASGEYLTVPQDYMLTATLDPQGASPIAWVRFRHGEGERDGYRLEIDFAAREVALGDGGRRFGRICDFDASKPVRVRIFTDGTIAECFDDDAYCFTMRIYDGRGDRVSFGSTGPGIVVRDAGVFVADRK